jgi:hypothetical protein
MKKTIALCVFLVCFLCPAFIWAQNAQNSPTYIESIVHELMYTIDRPSREMFLQYLTQAVQSGKFDPSVFDAISLLAHEGVSNPTRSEGRIVNDFPDIRVRACKLLGNIKTQESKESLLAVLRYDQDTTVLEAAVAALVNIGMNDNDQVVIGIVNLQQKENGKVRLSNTLAREILTAYDFFAPTVQRRSPMVQSVLTILTDYRYAPPVRKQAKDLLQKLLRL